MAENDEMCTDEMLLLDYSNPKHIHSIPDPLLLDIFSKLSFYDLCICARVCRRWYSLSKDFTLKKKIVITRQLRTTQFSSLVQHHFTHHLEEFQLQTSWVLDEFHLRTSFLKSLKRNTLWKICKKSNCMKKLVLTFCSLSSVSLNDLPSNLVHLSIRGSEIYPDLFFTKPQLSGPHLVCLDIGQVSNFLTSQDLYVLTNLKSLRALYMDGCFRINNGGIESIISILPQLFVLDVEGTDISNEGAITIFNHCHNATDLFLGHTDIDDSVLLTVGVNMVPCLTSLCVRKTKITCDVLHSYLNDVWTRRKSSRLPKIKCWNCHPIPTVLPSINNFCSIGCHHYLFHDVYGMMN